MILEGIAQKTIREMKEKGLVTNVSCKSTYNLDHAMAMELKPIREESEQKQNASRAYINDVESGRINFYER